jgi:hypothetical protein
MTLRAPILALLLAAATAQAADFPLLNQERVNHGRVALTRTGAAFIWATDDGLRAIVTDSRGTLPNDAGRILNGSQGVVASDGVGALFVWRDGSVIKASLMPSNVLTEEVIGQDPGVAEPAVAWDGTRYVIVWSHVSNAILTRTVDPATGRVDSSARVLSPGGADVPRNLSLASTGDGRSLVAWDRYTYALPSSAASTRVEIAALPDGAPRLLTAAGNTPAVASNGSDYFVAWNEQGVRGAAVSADGTPAEARTIAQGSNPRLAWNGARYILVWSVALINRIRVNYKFLGDNEIPVELSGDPFEYDYDVSARPETGEVAIVVGPSLRFASSIHVWYVDPVRARPVRRF